MMNVCFRNNGCRIRKHYHCNYNCKIKHEKGKKCENYQYRIPSFKLTPSKLDIYKLVQIMRQKYGFNDNVCEYLENNLILTKIEQIWLYDTFLSNKAITKENSIEWIKIYLDICFKYRTCSVMFIMFAELFYPSFRYDYIMSNSKFIKTIEKKYMEFINYKDQQKFTELFKKQFFKPLLEKVLKLRKV